MSLCRVGAATVGDASRVCRGHAAAEMPRLGTGGTTLAARAGRKARIVRLDRPINLNQLPGHGVVADPRGGGVVHQLDTVRLEALTVVPNAAIGPLEELLPGLGPEGVGFAAGLATEWIGR